MRLNVHDVISLEGFYPRNPITGAIIVDLPAIFTVTTAQEGDTINPWSLYPYPEDRETAIQMSAILTLNMVPIR